MDSNWLTLFLALTACSLIGFEAGKYVAVQKIREALKQMTDGITKATKQIQETKGEPKSEKDNLPKID